MANGKNEEWFCDNIKKMQNSIYRVAYIILRNSSDCEDAAGNAILAAYQKIDQIKDSSKFKAWFMKILKNECYAVLRKNKKVAIDLSEIALGYEDELNIDLHDALKQLRVEYRIAIVLYYLEGYCIKEIAQILEVPAGTVKSNLFRARSELKLILKDREDTKYETGF